MLKSLHHISEICMDPQPTCLKAVFLIETREQTEAREVSKLFSELESQVQVRQLSAGRLVSYCVHALQSDWELLDELEAVLKETYSFVLAQRSFDEVIYRVILDLCRDTNSTILPLSECNICGKTEPFPTIVIGLTQDDGSILASRSYCRRCTAEAGSTNHKEFVRSLLAADEDDFGKLARAELVRHPSRKQPVRFKVKA